MYLPVDTSVGYWHVFIVATMGNRKQSSVTTSAPLMVLHTVAPDYRSKTVSTPFQATKHLV